MKINIVSTNIADASFTVSELLRNESATRALLERSFALTPDLLATLMGVRIDSTQVKNRSMGVMCDGQGVGSLSRSEVHGLQNTQCARLRQI